MELVRLQRDFYIHSSIAVAKNLLGKYLVKDDLVGKIVETEAYGGTQDKASHASWKKRETCLPMWGIGGFSYVYLTYGMYNMLNVSTGEQGKPSAVLIRAIEPIINISGPTNGPGKLTRVLSIGKQHNNLDLTLSDVLYIAEDKDSPQEFKTACSTRIGVDYAGDYKDKKWRFYIRGNNYVSKL